MYGAVPYLMRSFDLDRNTAFKIVCDWLDRMTVDTVESKPLPRKARRTRAA
jgi:hypothetical protein